MSTDFFEKRFNNSDVVEKSDNGTVSPAGNSDPLTDEVPMDETPFQETSMGVSDSAVEPALAEPAADLLSADLPSAVYPSADLPSAVYPSAVYPSAVYQSPVDAGDQESLHDTPMVETFTNDVPTEGVTTHEAQFSEPVTHDAPVVTNTGGSPALLKSEESEHFRVRWNEIQGQFVDEPRSAVQKADALVSEVIEQITQMFASEHSLLEGQWKQGNDVSTEDLRKALQRYRSFFNRLVV